MKASFNLISIRESSISFVEDGTLGVTKAYANQVFLSGYVYFSRFLGLGNHLVGPLTFVQHCFFSICTWIYDEATSIGISLFFVRS